MNINIAGSTAKTSHSSSNSSHDEVQSTESPKTKPSHTQKGKGKHGKHDKESHEQHGKHDKHKEQGEEREHDKSEKNGKHGENDKHGKKGKHKQSGGAKHKSGKHDEHLTSEERKKGAKKEKHRPKPTLSEEMADDKKMADQYRNLLKHPGLLNVLQQMEDDGSGSASGSGEHGSGEKPTLEDYMKVLNAAKSKHKTKHGHRKSGLRARGSASKSSDVSKLHPVPLSKVDIDLIDALSSGAPSKLAFEFYLKHIFIAIMHMSHCDILLPVWKLVRSSVSNSVFVLEKNGVVNLPF